MPVQILAGDADEELKAHLASRGKLSDDDFEKPRDDFADFEDFEQDPEPVYSKPPLEERIISDKEQKPAKRVTVGVRKDIKAKLAMFLMLMAAPLETRDPICVGTFKECILDGEEEDGSEVPGIATALADIICDSPDMVKWFTSSGKYMKWFTLASTLQPVVQVAFHHHITHAIGNEDSPRTDFTPYVA